MLFFRVLLVYKLIYQEDSVIRMFRLYASLLFFSFALPILSHAQAAPAIPDRPFVVEYYYKAKWGHADEFLKLFKKDHYPVLKKEVEMGRIAKVMRRRPESRWPQTTP